MRITAQLEPTVKIARNAATVKTERNVIQRLVNASAKQVGADLNASDLVK